MGKKPLFSGGFSQEHSSWGDFGSLIGGVLGPALTFATFMIMLVNLEQYKKEAQKSEKRFNISLKENTFFKLLNNQQDIINKLQLREKNISGSNVFKGCAEIFNKIFADTIFFEGIDAFINNPIILGDIPFNLDSFWIITRERFPELCCGNPDTSSKISIINKLFGKKTKGENRELIEKIFLEKGEYTYDAKEIFKYIGDDNFRKLREEKRIDFLISVYYSFQEDSNYCLIQYFNSFRSILYFIEETDDKEKYFKILKSQLSINEINLLYYNIFSKSIDEKYLKLMLKHKMLENARFYDLTFFINGYNEIKKDIEERIEILRKK